MNSKMKILLTLLISTIIILMASNASAALYTGFPDAGSDALAYSDSTGYLVSYYPAPPPTTYDCEDGDDVRVQYNCSYDDQRSSGQLFPFIFYFNITAYYSGTYYYNDWGPISTYGDVSDQKVFNVIVLNVDVDPYPATINITYTADIDGPGYDNTHILSFYYIFV